MLSTEKEVEELIIFKRVVNLLLKVNLNRR